MPASQENNAPVVTLDGPSGSGKGTISQRLASHLGWHFLDSGALYRALAQSALGGGIELGDEHRLATLAGELDVAFLFPTPEQQVVLLDGRDVTAALRSERCGSAASQVASLPAVRQALLERQRRFRQPPGLVADGRDMGTVVFPSACVKIFLTARPEVRARRRYNQLNINGNKISLEELIREVEARDHRDATRKVAPLRPAEDACVLDNSDQDTEETFSRVLGIVQAGLKKTLYN